MKMYIVGGYVRDKILGVRSKDIDFSVVLTPYESYISLGDPFGYMVYELKNQGFTIYVETPEHLTARGRFPKDHPAYPNVDADFVLARKEGEYTDGRRPDSVEVGTLEDDLARRDFTMNAIAMDEDGNYIDPFGGRDDIEDRIIRAVGDPYNRMTEDALRAVRAMRFAVTKQFDIDPVLHQTLTMETSIANALVENISDERIADELSKMFRFNTVEAIRILNVYPMLRDAIFSGRVSLDATLKTKGRGK